MVEPHFTPSGAGAEGDYLSRIAAGWVARLAPPPDPETTEYADMAEAAEWAVYNHLKATSGGSVLSKSRSGLSVTFADPSRIRDMIAAAMGPYFVGAAGRLRIRRTERA